ncbi:MAG: hypothetical protein R6X09_10275 [Bacteroidales bacterium]
MNRKIHNNHAFCKVLLLLLFIGYYSSLNLFYHPHLINGKVVYHSHPYKNSEGQNTGKKPLPAHQHNKDEFYYIQQLDKSIWDDLVAKPNLPEIAVLQNKRIASDLPVKPVTSSNTAICPRAPPPLILFA